MPAGLGVPMGLWDAVLSGASVSEAGHWRQEAAREECPPWRSVPWEEGCLPGCRCVFIQVCAYVDMYICAQYWCSLYIYTHVHAQVQVYTGVCMCTGMYMYADVYTCRFLGVKVVVCIVQVCTGIYVYAGVYVFRCLCGHRCACA